MGTSKEVLEIARYASDKLDGQEATPIICRLVVEVLLDIRDMLSQEKHAEETVYEKMHREVAEGTFVPPEGKTSNLIRQFQEKPTNDTQP